MLEKSRAFSRNAEEVDLSLVLQSRRIPRKSVSTPIISLRRIGGYRVSTPRDEVEDDSRLVEHYSWAVSWLQKTSCFPTLHVEMWAPTEGRWDEDVGLYQHIRMFAHLATITSSKRRNGHYRSNPQGNTVRKLPLTAEDVILVLSVTSRRRLYQTPSWIFCTIRTQNH